MSQPPAQELSVNDLHDILWAFRHIYRGVNPLIEILGQFVRLFVNI